MSTPPTSSAAPSARPREPFSAQLRNFWQRVSEGRQIDDLWTQFAADARASYGFYGSDIDWDEIKKLPRWRRPLHIAKQFFWALLLKLTPARRILLLAAFLMLILSDVKILDIRFEFLAGGFPSSSLPRTRGQSHHEARSGNRARDSDRARAVRSAGSPRRGNRVRLASAKFRGR